MSDQLAKKTIRRVTDALGNRQTGALSEIVQIVRKLSGQAAHVSISELSELIGRDPTITEKVVNAANTFGYNPSGLPITTITEAIHTVGYERIRNLTLSLMLAESAGLKLNNEEQREMAALAVCSGMLAQMLVSENATFRVDAETAFVGASLRNYGKLLMSTFFVDEYLEARDRAASHDPDRAYLEIFGLTPLALGRTLLKSTNLPREIMASLESVPNEVLARESYTAEEEVLIAAEFCGRICAVAFDERIGPDAFAAAVGAIISDFSRSFPLDQEVVMRGLETVDEMMRRLNAIIGVKDESSPASRKLRSRLQGIALAPRPRSEQRATPTAAASDSAPSPRANGDGDLEAREAGAELSFQKVQQRLAASLQPGSRVDLAEVFTAVSQTILDSLGLESCLAFTADPHDPKRQRYGAASGVGPLFGKVKNRPLIAPANKDIFSICLGRREDILIQDTKAGKIASIIPDWIHAKGAVTSLVILPASNGADLFAIFVGAVTNGTAIHLRENDLRRLRQLRGQLAALRGLIDQQQVSTI